jgi:hypothetical protein
VAANGLVFLLVYRRRTLLRKTNFFLISLAVSDISTGLIGIPLVIMCNTYQTDQLCKTMDICNKFLAISTILHLLSATIERYIKVLAPLHYRRLVTKQRILLILAGIWLLSFITPLIEITWDANLTQITQTYSIILLCCFFIFPLTVMSLVTLHIFYLIKQQKNRLKILVNRNMAKKQQKRKQAERRAIIVYSAMSISFAVGWFPYFLLAFMSDYLGDYELPYWADSVLLFLKFSTGLVDPLLYTFFKTDFQTALRSMLFNPYENITTRNTMQLTLQTQNNQRNTSSD